MTGALSIPLEASPPARLPSPLLAAGLVLLCLTGGVLAVVILDAPLSILAGRAIALREIDGPCFWIPGDLLLGRIVPVGPLPALLTQSLCALPALLVIGFAGAPGREPRVPHALLAAGHPASLVLVFAGLGWAAVSLFAAARLVAMGERLPVEKGVPLAGLSLAAVTLFVPLPPAAVGVALGALTATAHRTIRRAHKRAFLLLIALPALLLQGALAYSGWLYGAAPPLVEPRGEGWLLLIAGLGLLSAGLAPQRRWVLAASLGGSALAFFLADPFMG